MIFGGIFTAVAIASDFWIALMIFAIALAATAIIMIAIAMITFQ